MVARLSSGITHPYQTLLSRGAAHACGAACANRPDRLLRGLKHLDQQRYVVIEELKIVGNSLLAAY